jgi:cytochrome c556
MRAVRRYLLLPLVIAAAAAPLLASPADQARQRVSAYRSLGAAFKTVTDATRSGRVQTPQVRQAAATIGGMARRQYGLFPRGSGARPGVKTAAKPEIWARAGEFRAAQDAFARQAGVLQAAVNRGDADAIRSEVRKLGATCKSCHDTFRMESD